MSKDIIALLSSIVSILALASCIVDIIENEALKASLHSAECVVFFAIFLINKKLNNE